MDVAGAVPGIGRDDPATCITTGGPPATPPPSPTPTPDGSEPTPTPDGGPTPTFAPSPTPTPGPGCSAVEVTVSASYSQTDVLGITGTLVYPANAGIPGFLDGPLVQARVTNLTGVSAVLGVRDEDDKVPPFLNFGLTTGAQPLPAGSLVRVRFDCVGPGTPSAGQFTCAPLAIATFLGEETQAPCTLNVSVLP
jgi:hypothetical protein